MGFQNKSSRVASYLFQGPASTGRMEAFRFVFDVIRSNIKLSEKFAVDLDEGLYAIDVLTRLWESVEESTDTSFLYWSLDNMVMILC